MNINAFGKPCPMPLVMAKKEIDAGCKDLTIAVDNDTAVKNLTRLGSKTGLAVSVNKIEGGWQVNLSEGGSNTERSVETLAYLGVDVSVSGSGYAVFIGKDHVGEGDPALGYNLMKMALYTLSESDVVPVSLLFMNSGVKLAASDEAQVVESIEALIDKGTEVLVCGTCLDFYHIKDALKVGDISNMYDILERMQEASKVISL